MRAAIYNHMQQRLEAIEQVKWIDLDTRQVSEPKDNYPIPFPAVLIDFGNFDYTERTKGAQELVVSVSLNIWQYRYADKFNAQGVQEINTLFNLIDQIGLSVHNSYMPQLSITPFKRTSERTITQFGTLFGYAIDFDTTLMYCPDESTAPINQVRIPSVQYKQPAP